MWEKQHGSSYYPFLSRSFTKTEQGETLSILSLPIFNIFYQQKLLTVIFSLRFSIVGWTELNCYTDKWKYDDDGIPAKMSLSTGYEMCWIEGNWNYTKITIQTNERGC